MINVGVIGSGSIVDEFVEAVKDIKGYHFVGIYNRHLERTERFKDYFEYCTDDLNKILNDPKIEAIYVALPNGVHYEYAMKVLQHGKHAFVEKPFTHSYLQAKKLLAYADAHDLVCVEACVIRYNPIYNQLKKHIKQLGDIKMIDANFTQYSRRYDKFKQGVILPVFDKKLAGGALLDLNVYNIHFTTGIFGKPKKIQYFPNMEKGVDTAGVLVLDYGTFKASLIAGKNSKCEAYMAIHGDKGFVKTYSAAGTCNGYKLYHNDGKVDEVPGFNDPHASFDNEFKAIAKLIKTKDKKLIKSYNEATLLTVWVMDKALQSANIKY